ncbi:MAG: hypothetical protein U9N43_04150 [Euryarchaeota archaeon]|nr:hypothetical protein [Euryarchaeota archaeon]
MNKRTIILVALVVLSMVGAATANEAAGYENLFLNIDGDNYMTLAEAQDRDIVSIANVTLQPGATTTVPIQLLNSTGVGGIAVTLTFNPLIVNVTTGVVGDFNDNFNLDCSNISDGVVRVTCTTSGQDLTGDLNIATITLEAVGASGSCELGLSAELSNRTGGDVPPTTNNETFTISTTLFDTINVTPAGPLTMNITDTETFTAVCYNGSTEVTGITVEWVSSNMNAGTITSGGVFTAAVGGTTSITATAQGVTSNVVTVTVGTATELIGDINGDNIVNYIDLGILGASYGLSIGAAGYNAAADLNGDNEVNYVDLGMLGAHYGESI